MNRSKEIRPINLVQRNICMLKSNPSSVNVPFASTSSCLPVSTTTVSSSESFHCQTRTPPAVVTSYSDHYSTSSYLYGDFGSESVSCFSLYPHQSTSEHPSYEYSQGDRISAYNVDIRHQQSSPKVLTQLNPSGNVLVHSSSPFYTATPTHIPSFTLTQELPIPSDLQYNEEDDILIQNVIRDHPVIGSVIEAACSSTTSSTTTEPEVSSSPSQKRTVSPTFATPSAPVKRPASSSKHRPAPKKLATKKLQPVVRLHRLDTSSMATTPSSLEDTLRMIHDSPNSDHEGNEYEVRGESEPVILVKTLSPERQRAILESVTLTFNEINWEDCVNADLFLVTEARLVALYLFTERVHSGIILGKKSIDKLKFFNVKKDFTKTTYKELEARYTHCIDTALDTGKKQSIGDFINEFDTRYNWIIVFVAGLLEYYDGKRHCGTRMKISAQELYVSVARRIEKCGALVDPLRALLRSTRRVFIDILESMDPRCHPAADSASEYEEVSTQHIFI